VKGRVEVMPWTLIIRDGSEKLEKDPLNGSEEKHKRRKDNRGVYSEEEKRRILWGGGEKRGVGRGGEGGG